MQANTCCIIGYQDIPADKLDNVRLELECEVRCALEDGYRFFIAEFTEGVGILFARHFGEWRKEYSGTYWEAVLSRLDQAEQFSREKWELLSTCNGLRGLCADCKAEYPLSVTRELVRLSQRVIVMNSDDHDTLYAMDYARSMERELRKVDIY